MRNTKSRRRHVLRAAAFCLFAFTIQAAEPDLTSPVGRWKTVDDHTGKEKSIVAIYEDQGKLFGRVEKTLDPNAKKICKKCKDERKGQPIVGMIVIRDLQKNGAEYGGGNILDPDNGTVYRCKIRLTDAGAKLVVRGFIGFSLLGRSQTWTREP